MDFKLAEKETVDPTYLWIGPNEKPLTGKSFDFNIFFNVEEFFFRKALSLIGMNNLKFNFNCSFTYSILKPYSWFVPYFLFMQKLKQ